jgi:two-component system response regulator YesN
MTRLLVVDDEWLIRKGIVKMIKRLNPAYVVEEANNGKEAVDSLTGSSYDLIFSDIKMPGLDGIQMLELLNDHRFRVPVVFLTGYDEFQYMQDAIRLRAYDYLLKPIHDDDMIAVLSRFQKDFMTMTKMSPKDHAMLQKFEFELLNALESLDSAKVHSVMEEGQQLLKAYMFQRQYVDEVIRIANQFFAQNGIHAFDKDLSLSSNDVSNLANIQHAIHLRLSHMRERINVEEDKIIKLAKEYIEAHMEHPLSLHEVANVVHFNPTYFSEYFKEKSGETFSQYVTRTKIEKAKQLLHDPTARIADISEYVGYKDPRSFTKMFKLFLGMTPKEYRDSRL